MFFWNTLAFPMIQRMLAIWSLFHLPFLNPTCTSANCGKYLKTREYQTILPGSWENCMQLKKKQLELDMEQQTGPKLGKEYNEAVYCHPVYLICMQSTCKMPGWMKHKLESRLLGEISVTSGMQMTQWQKGRGTKELNEGKRGEWKIWLKTQHSKN